MDDVDESRFRTDGQRRALHRTHVVVAETEIGEEGEHRRHAPILRRPGLRTSPGLRSGLSGPGIIGGFPPLWPRRPRLDAHVTVPATSRRRWSISRSRSREGHPSSAMLGTERMGAGVAVAPDRILTVHYLVARGLSCDGLRPRRARTQGELGSLSTTIRDWPCSRSRESSSIRQRSPRSGKAARRGARSSSSLLRLVTSGRAPRATSPRWVPSRPSGSTPSSAPS